MLKRFGLVLLILIILSMAAAFSMWYNCRPSNKGMPYSELVKPQNQLTLDAFIESSKGFGVIRTEVYYMPFSAKTMVIPFEEDILSEGLLIVACENITVLHPQYIANALKGFSGEEQKDSSRNFRYSCVMYAGHKAIRFSIALSSLETIVINGVPYKASPEIVDAFLKLLPTVDYEKAIKWINE